MTEAGATQAQAEAGRSRKDLALGALEAVPFLVSDSWSSNPKRTISVTVCYGSHKHGDSLKVSLPGNGFHTPTLWHL